MSLTTSVTQGHPSSPGTELDRLTELLARFEALFESVPLALAVFDEALMLVRANTRFNELTGGSNSQGYGRSAYDAFPNALADCTDLIDGALRDRGVTVARLPFMQGTTRRLVEGTFMRIGEAFGTRGMIFIASDVTEREELREDLARSVAQIESFFDLIPDSVRVVDAAGVIVRSNAQAQRDHGSSAPQSVSALWQHDRPRTLAGTSLFLHEHPTSRALNGETVRGETLTVRRHPEGAESVIEVSANPLHDANGRTRGAVTVERDVTVRARLAQELQAQVLCSQQLYERVSTEAERLERMVEERTEELLRLQEERSRDRRLAAVGQLAAGVMHDVNNALNPIMAAAYLLEVHADNPAAVRDYAARIARAADTGAATAARVGRFIRQEPLAGELDETFDLSEVTTEVLAMTQPLWAERVEGGHVTVEQSLTRGILVRGIPGEIREALLNLLQNALDAMPAGGLLRISTSVEGEEACIEVRDTGMGMTDEVRERAFEPFFSTKGRLGTGLGLSEVYGIVRRHRGRIEIQSEPGKGTTIRLSFPTTAPVAGPVPLPRPRRAAPQRVLLVEDNDDGRHFMSAVLAVEGHLVEAVATVHDGLACLARGPERPYDVLLTDIGLTDGNGWDLVAEARRRWPAIRVGVVTGWELRPAGAVEADFTLRKPVPTQELLARVAGES